MYNVLLSLKSIHVALARTYYFVKVNQVRKKPVLNLSLQIVHYSPNLLFEVLNSDKRPLKLHQIPRVPPMDLSDQIVFATSSHSMNHDAVAEDAITIHCWTGQSGLADVRGAQFLQLVLHCQVRAAV